MAVTKITHGGQERYTLDPSGGMFPSFTKSSISVNIISTGLIRANEGGLMMEINNFHDKLGPHPPRAAVLQTQLSSYYDYDASKV